MIHSIYRRIKLSFSYKLAIRSSDKFIAYLRQKGMTIGNNCTFYSPSTHTIDSTRPELITIGNHVKVAANSVFLTHGFDWSVLRHIYPGELFGSAGCITIGNNVFIGMRTTILKGSIIGDNSVIGAGSIVAGIIPPNSVAAGSPAKVLCTIDELYKKYRDRELQEAKLIAQRIFLVRGQQPVINDFKEYFYLFATGEQAEEAGLNVRRQTTDLYYDKFMRDHKPIFNSFDDFLKYCEIL